MTGDRSAFPQKLLLATDLSARCDRALDRATLLAAEWKANLTVVHVLEKTVVDPSSSPRRYVPSWRLEPDRRYAVAKRQIQQDLHDHGIPFELAIEEGDPSDVVVRISEQLGNDFLITGVARDETLGRMILGGTVDRLVRSAVAPVLAVKTRARRLYQQIVVAVDFSKASKAALLKTVALFPEARISVLHCYTPLASGFIDPDTSKNVGRDMAEGEYQDFLKGLGLPANVISSFSLLLERGSLDGIIQAYALDNALDLLVIGSQGCNAVARFILGSAAELLLSTAPCDVLVFNGAQRN